MNPKIDERAFSILSSLYQSMSRFPSIRQRELAERLGLSLGLTNQYLHLLAKEGYVAIERLSARDFLYRLTDKGMAELAACSLVFFTRSAPVLRVYLRVLEDLIGQRLRQGCGAVLLFGVSDLEFLVELVCQKKEILFMKALTAESLRRPLREKVLYLYSEKLAPGSIDGQIGGVYLAELCGPKAFSAELGLVE